MSAAPDIRKKLQSLEWLGGKKIRELVAMVEKVYNKRETEEQKEERKKRLKEREKRDRKQERSLARILE